MCRFLHKHGYASIEASSATEAVTVLKHEPVVAVILDVRLSGSGSGLDLLAALRQQPALATTPAIVMTAGKLTESERTFVEEQNALLFYKPDGLSALIECLQQITGRSGAKPARQRSVDKPTRTVR